MTTVSLPLAVWGEDYARFIPQWWDGVKSLARKPDEIVLVTDLADSSGLFESVPDWVDIPVVKIIVDCSDFCEYWNEAIFACSSEWFSICNVDDYFLPNALDQVDEADEADCNFIIDKLRVKQTNETWSGYWDESEIPYRFTLPGAEIMRKDLFVTAGGYRVGFQFPDWALAVDIVHKGLAKPFHANTTRIVFDMGTDHVTMSGALLNPQKKLAGIEQVQGLSKSLGLLPVQ